MRLPDCSRITPKIGESLDRRLGPAERLIMKLHIFTCDRCGRYLNQLRFLNRTFHQHGERIADPPTQGIEFAIDSKHRIKEMLGRLELSTVR